MDANGHEWEGLMGWWVWVGSEGFTQRRDDAAKNQRGGGLDPLRRCAVA